MSRDIALEQFLMFFFHCRYFSIDNFDSLFEETVVGPEQSLIIKLTASSIRPGIHSDEEGDKQEFLDDVLRLQESKKQQEAQAELLQHFARDWPYFPTDRVSPPAAGKQADGNSPAMSSVPAPLFQGMVAHKALEGAFFKSQNRRAGSGGGAPAKGEATRATPEFLVLRGPNKRGKAQVAIVGGGGQQAHAGVENRGGGGWFKNVWDKLSGAKEELKDDSRTGVETGIAGDGVKLNALLTYIHLHWSDLVDKLFDVDGL